MYGNENGNENNEHDDNIEYENVSEPDEEQIEQENNNEYGNEIELQIPEQGNVETESGEADNDFENEMDERYEMRSENCDLCPRRPHDYSHLDTTLESIIMTQHSMKKRIKLFGEAGVDAVL